MGAFLVPGKKTLTGYANISIRLIERQYMIHYVMKMNIRFSKLLLAAIKSWQMGTVKTRED